MRPDLSSILARSVQETRADIEVPREGAGGSCW